MGGFVRPSLPELSLALLNGKFFPFFPYTLHLYSGKGRIFLSTYNAFANIILQSRLLFVVTTALSALAFGRRGSATAPAPPTTTV